MNNAIPLKFIMDTGVRSTIITNKDLTDVLNLPYNRVITINGPGDFTMLEAYVVSQIDLCLEGVTGYDQTILVLKDDYLKLKNFMGIDVHGMIGATSSRGPRGGGASRRSTSRGRRKLP